MAGYDVMQQLVVSWTNPVELTFGCHALGLLALYATYIVWTVLYNTVYDS
jgi:hypothetical protein